MYDLVELRKDYQKFLNSTVVEKLSLELRQPNFFNILRIEHAEIRHSNFLAWLLDPKESHGLGETLTKKLFIELFFNEKSVSINDHYLSEIDYSNIRVYREWNNIDILLKCPIRDSFKDNLLICIENKVRSVDSENQLNTYFNKINENFPEENNDSIFVYLTISGEDPTKIVHSAKFINISYEFIIQSLNQILDIYGENIIPKVKTYLQDYIQTLNRNYMDTDDTILYARQIYSENKALFDFVMSKGIENKFSHVANQFCDDLDLKLICSKETWFSFIPTTWVESLEEMKVADPTSRGLGYPLSFEFTKWKDNLYLTLIVYPFSDQEFRKKFIDTMKTVATLRSRNIKAIDKILLNDKDSKWTTLHSGKKEITDWGSVEAINQGCKYIYDLKKDLVLNEIISKTPEKINLLNELRV
ncbi:MAG: PDDEXK-like family protein [Daejeonella sp.]